MKRNFLICWLVLLGYLGLLEVSGLGAHTYGDKISGVSFYGNAGYPALLAFTFQAMFTILIFDRSREFFYHRNIVQLVRYRSRVQLFLRLVRNNILAIVLLDVALAACNWLVYPATPSRGVLLQLLIQMNGLCLYGLVQTILELKVSSTFALITTMIGAAAFERLNWLPSQLIHTSRLTANPGTTLIGAAIVLILLVVLGASLIRKQEIV
ncbi:hypothetical protein [Lacticaseibacillus mingshuiensis]|uniref:ABC transporter permease n=1 Tax=Lacticaseibacillus mingshuiensis TaxID=2799574 RepID=A0ABW4CKF2_9LACO|nr:hypothetical protein [Lacticaseibacillus mingshuiensis]